MMREKDTALAQKPQINLSRSTAGRMWLVSACAIMAVIQSAMTDSGASMGIALTAVFTAVLTEALICYHRTGQALSLRDGSAVASALVFALLLPNRIHPVYAAAGTVFAIGVIKHSFGGLGANWMNPAAGAWLFTRYSWPGAFRQALEASPLAFSPDNLDSAFSPAAVSVSSFLNRTVFSLTGAQLPANYIDLFISSADGIIADRGIGALLLGTIIITATQVNRPWVPALYLGLYGFLIRNFGALPPGGNPGKGDVLFGFLSGGTLAAAFLLTGDPVTGAKSGAGVLLTVILAALTGYLFRYPGGDPYGAFLAVLLVNALIPLIRNFESRQFLRQGRPL